MSDENPIDAPVEAPKINQPHDVASNQQKQSNEIIHEEAEVELKDKGEKEKQRAFESIISKSKGDGRDSMNVKVYSPSRTYFDGLAFSVTAANATGEFDVLPQHHRFISLLNECDLIIRSVDEGNRKITISGGLMHVKEGRVAVFLDI